MSELWIEDIVLPDGRRGACRVEAGRIAALGDSGASGPPPGVPRLAGRGRLLLPGAIDPHVHCRQPGGEHKETLVTAGRAAVKGGTTTVGDMPNTDPPTTTVERLADKRRLAGGSPARLLLHFGADGGHLEALRDAAREPDVRAVKVYMGPSTGAGGLAPEAVERCFRLAAEVGLPVMVHAESPERIAADRDRFPRNVWHHHRLRDLAGELEAVERALALARDCGTRLYLCHVTSAQVLERVEASGLRDRVHVEVCPHHLLLSTGSIRAPGENRYKVNPPLRPEPERRGLWAALADRIDGLGSDHAPHTEAEKERPYDEAPSGIPGVEHMLPLAIDWWRRGYLSLERLLALTSGNAARFLGLEQGRLAPGAPADLVLADPEREWTVGQGSDTIASKCGWSLYTGMRLLGRPEVTIVAGRVVHEAPPL